MEEWKIKTPKTQTETGLELVVEREFAADPSAVFDALTNVEKLMMWMAPGEMTVADAISDVRVGGDYKIVMRGADGNTVTTSGTYQEVIPNERVVHTWQWGGSDEVTLVEIVLQPLPSGGTRLRLVHSRFTDSSTRDAHESGWQACLQKLSV